MLFYKLNYSNEYYHQLYILFNYYHNFKMINNSYLLYFNPFKTISYFK